LKLVYTKLNPVDSVRVINLLTESMSTNPINRAVFGSGDGAIRKQLKLFEWATAPPHTVVNVAKEGDKIVGVLCYCTSEHCQLAPMDLAKKLPSLMWQMGMNLGRLLRWRKKWSQHDHKKPHIHLGPVAVDLKHQGKGVGTFMMKEVCQFLDAHSVVGYLETDKPENVAFYKRFGFDVEGEEKILGVTNWFMVRPVRTL
jgi:Predicted acetyltransferase